MDRCSDLHSWLHRVQSGRECAKVLADEGGTAAGVRPARVPAAAVLGGWYVPLRFQCLKACPALKSCVRRHSWHFSVAPGCRCVHMCPVCVVFRAGVPDSQPIVRTVARHSVEHGCVLLVSGQGLCSSSWVLWAISSRLALPRSLSSHPVRANPRIACARPAHPLPSIAAAVMAVRGGSVTQPRFVSGSVRFSGASSRQPSCRPCVSLVCSLCFCICVFSTSGFDCCSGRRDHGRQRPVRSLLAGREVDPKRAYL
jgi:hypothetical protein